MSSNRKSAAERIKSFARNRRFAALLAALALGTAGGCDRLNSSDAGAIPKDAVLAVQKASQGLPAYPCCALPG